MPIGAHPNHANGMTRGIPTWFYDLVNAWDVMPVVALSSIRKQAVKRNSLDKGFYFDPNQIPVKFGNFCARSNQVYFRTMLTTWLEQFGLDSTQHFHIGFIEEDEANYRIPDTPRICYVWRCGDIGFAATSQKLSPEPVRA